MSELSPVLMAEDLTAAFDEALAASPPFDSESLDGASRKYIDVTTLPPPAMMLVDEALELNDFRASGRGRPWMPWEIIW